MTPPKSPAVEALEQEQAHQSQDAQSELDAGLKGSFPASDPVSATTTSIPIGTAPAFSPDDNRSDAPLVDEALASTKESVEIDEPSAFSSQEELEALKAEVARLRESASEIGAATVRVAKAQASDLIADIEKRVRSKPLSAVGIAAIIGFVWGMTR
ncbi:hypothetical protein [Neorhizobium alkalisoli]|uniref:ElaB/YqjD/DUF883 family membrane-anchored ribosome-binding protein n=1 Tax=Neorhizobium alkalisoli TaxID=528178 RepID=A0A561QBS9_9HYPH|nr:hypothetical protein [Neorhizobium alkalisoli]TWF47807.1 hypothetical protein FHW37_110104 [Neorhizobium alkalisoli]